MKWLRSALVISVLGNFALLSHFAGQPPQPSERQTASAPFAPPGLLASGIPGLALLGPSNGEGLAPPVDFPLPQGLVPIPSTPVAADCEKFVDFMLDTPVNRYSPVDFIDSISKCKRLPNALGAAELEFRRACAEAKRALSVTEQPGQLADPLPLFVDATMTASSRCSQAVEGLQTAIAINERGETPIAEINDLRILVRLQRAPGSSTQDSEQVAKRIAELLPNDVLATANYIDQLGVKALFEMEDKSDKSWQEAQLWVEKGRTLDPTHPYLEEMDLFTRTKGFSTSVEAELTDHDKRYPNSGYGAYRAGIAAAMAGNEKEAETFFQRAIDREPRELRYRANLDRLRRHEPVENYNPGIMVGPEDLLLPKIAN